jgi:hypothetical protein
MFLAFAECIRRGGCFGGSTASSTTVQTTLRICAKILDQRGYPDPRRPITSQKQLDNRFSTLFRKYSEQDPPPRQQLALPTDPFRWLDSTFRAMNSTNPIVLALIDLIILAFFFLLRVGEYIASAPGEQTKKRTVPLRKKDLRFWDGETLLDHDRSDLEERATAVSIALENQKNGCRGTGFTIHQQEILLSVQLTRQPAE